MVAERARRGDIIRMKQIRVSLMFDATIWYVMRLK
jgi:hypothetical protein